MSGASAPVPGITASVATTVAPHNTARAVDSGSMDVFSTPMLVALMEQAACAALAGSLAHGQTTVGTSIAIEHTAASPLGATVTATATLTAVEGRLLTFRVSARDSRREVGAGTHTRAIVDAQRFMQKAQAAE